MKSKVKIRKTPKKAIKEIESLAKRMKGKDTVKVGLPKNSNVYPDGTSVIMVGAVHEFGSPRFGIPERSYLRSTLVEQRRAYKALCRKLAKKMLEGLSKDEALAILGLKVQTDVRDKITDLKEPSLKYREGNPLVDTGHLRQSIVYVVGEDK